MTRRISATADDRRRRSLIMALQRGRENGTRLSAIPDNSDRWTNRHPRSVAEAIALSDEIEAYVREWSGGR